MLNQNLVRGSLFMGSLLPSPARPTRRTPRRPHTELSDIGLERVRTENSALRQRLTEQGRELRHATLLLDAARAENAVMRQNIAELRQAHTTRRTIQATAEALA